ncbi:hypothetical protein [Spirulina major]|uniref:hypothetical protein n=1 Tax=Spirulina major TaxID=270636 RepID=UPI001114989D|nr:hypothetical protein [Spirulina major]
MTPKKARQRHPEDPVVATFMIPYAAWQEFKTRVEAQGETVSGTLLAFIQGYLAAVRSPQGAAEVVNARVDAVIDHKMMPWQQQAIATHHRLARIEAKMDVVEIHVETLKRHNDARWIDVDSYPTHDDPRSATVPSSLSEIELCRRFGINPYNLDHNASLRRLSIPEYLHELTGWHYHNGHYLPPAVRSAPSP